MPLFPKHFSMPRNGHLVAVTVRNSDELRKLRTELELLRRVNRQMLLRTMAAGQAIPGKYTATDNIELKHILNDASHPLVIENITQIERNFVNSGKDIMMSVINDEADNLFHEAIETGATSEQDTATGETATHSVTEQSDIADNPVPSPQDAAINDDLLQATAELAEVVGLDLANAEAMNVAIVDECSGDETNEISNAETESTCENVAVSPPISNESTVVVVADDTNMTDAPTVLSDGTSGDHDMVIDVEAPIESSEIATHEAPDIQNIECDIKNENTSDCDNFSQNGRTSQSDEYTTGDCDVAANNGKVSMATEKNETCTASVKDTPDESDRNPAVDNNNDNPTSCNQPNTDCEHNAEETPLKNVSSAEPPVDEQITEHPPIAKDESITKENTSEMVSASNECGVVSSLARTPEAAKMMLDELQQGMRKLTNILSTEVSDEWRRASDALGDIVIKREQADAAVQNAESLVADLKTLRTEATTARDDIISMLADVRHNRDCTKRAKQRADASADAAEISADQATEDAAIARNSSQAKPTKVQ